MDTKSQFFDSVLLEKNKYSQRPQVIATKGPKKTSVKIIWTGQVGAAWHGRGPWPHFMSDRDVVLTLLILLPTVA